MEAMRCPGDLGHTAIEERKREKEKNDPPGISTFREREPEKHAAVLL